MEIISRRRREPLDIGELHLNISCTIRVWIEPNHALLALNTDDNECPQHRFQQKPFHKDEKFRVQIL